MRLGIFHLRRGLVLRPSPKSHLISAFAAPHHTRSCTSMAIQQPKWALPQRQAEEPVLKVYNSLTRTKTEFVANNGRHVKWYNCGPTVYDASHMGHARMYCGASCPIILAMTSTS